MTIDLYTNDARSTLASGISNSTSSLTVGTGDGSKFPASNFWIKLTDGVNIEYAYVGSRSGDSFSSVSRGQDNSTAHAFSAGTTVAHVWNVGSATGLMKRFSSRDVAANRPSAGAVGGENGALFLATDTGTLSHSDGSTWANAGAYIKLAETTVGVGGVASITFSSISASYRTLKLFIEGRCTNSSQDIDILIRFNSDSGANYDYQGGLQYMVSSASAQLSYATAATTSGQIGYLAAATAPANSGSQIEATFINYAGTAFHKSAYVQNAHKIGSTVNDFRLIHVATFWRSTSAINSITINPSAGNFAQNLVAALYGVL